MLALLKYYFVPPEWADPEKTRLGRLAYWIALAMLAVCVLVIILFLSLVPNVAYRAWLVVPMIVVLLGLIPVIHRAASALQVFLCFWRSGQR